MSLRAVVALVYSALAERADSMAPNEETPGAARKELDRILAAPQSARSRRPKAAALAAEIEGLKGLRNVGISYG